MRISCAVLVAGLAIIAPVTNAVAGVPRGVMLVANEQIADMTTGTTLARGDAEITVAGRPISGKADQIEVRPNLNEILFTGSARVIVGSDHYESEVVSCTLDFSRCGPTNAGASAHQPPTQTTSTAAAITPR